MQEYMWYEFEKHLPSLFGKEMKTLSQIMCKNRKKVNVSSQTSWNKNLMFIWTFYRRPNSFLMEVIFAERAVAQRCYMPPSVWWIRGTCTHRIWSWIHYSFWQTWLHNGAAEQQLATTQNTSADILFELNMWQFLKNTFWQTAETKKGSSLNLSLSSRALQMLII